MRKSLSLKELYLENGAYTDYGYYIDFYSDEEQEYYDLKNTAPNNTLYNCYTLLCDGEQVEFLEDQPLNWVIVKNIGGIELHFSKEEISIMNFE